MPFSETSTTSLALRYLAASQLDLDPIRHIGPDFFNSEYTGLDTNVYLDLAGARLFCRLIVRHVDPTLLNYLGQYFGTLQELSLFLRKDSDVLAGRFWVTVLQPPGARC